MQSYFAHTIYKQNNSMNESKENTQTLLSQFINQEQEDAEFLRKQIFVQTKPSYKHEENPNPNAPSRLVGKIFDSYNQMIKGVFNMQVYLNNYLQNLSIRNQKLAIQEKIKNSPATVEQQQKMYYQQLCLQEIPLKLFKISLLRQDQEREAITYCINKLKVMVIKAKYKQSTTLQYLIDSYTASLRDALSKHDLRYKQQKLQKYRLLQVLFAKHEFMQSAFESLKIKYDVISLKELKLCKIAPNSYLNGLYKKTIIQKPLFFINFYTQPLLFIQNQFNHFQPSLLYCPVVSIDSVVLISQYYLRMLNQKCLEWASQILIVEVYHPQTSKQVPLFCSKINSKTFEDNNIKEQNKRQNNNEPKHFRIKKEIANFNKLIKTIAVIRRFVFVKLIFHWLKQILGGTPNEPIQIDIYQKFKVMIKIVAQDYRYAPTKRTPEHRSEIISNLLILTANKRNPIESRQSIREKIYNTLQSSLLKIVAQKTGTRVTWPLQNGSMGLYYYDFSKEKVNRYEVKQFINNF